MFAGVMEKRRSFIKKTGLVIALLASSILFPLKSSFATGGLNKKGRERWLDLLKYARRSPSPHNIQPWKLKLISADNAELYYDPKRLISYTDPDNRFMVIGLVIFVEYLSIAAMHHGLKIHATYKGEVLDHHASGPQLCAKLTLVPHTGEIEFDRELIMQRRTSRLPYNDEPIDDESMVVFNQLASRLGHDLGHSHDMDMVNWTLELNRDTLFNDLNDKGVRDELKPWLRYSKKEAESKKDGLWAKCMRFPGWFMKTFFEHPEKYSSGRKKEILAKHYVNKMKGSHTVAWISGPFDTFESWVSCGRLLAHFWLKMTEKGMYLHPFGSIITNEESHTQLAQKLQFEEGKTKLWFIVRMGYSKEPPESYRLEINDLLIN